MAVMLVSAVALLCYGRTLGYGFLQTWDDDTYVFNNAASHGFSLPNLTAAFSTFYVGNYAPLHIVSYMVDYTVWGLNPAGYHLSNLFLHALNGCLLLHILNKIFIDRKTALFATLIFIVHPVQVESVAWVSERKNLLGFMFIMLTLLCHITWRNTYKRKFYWFSIAMTVAALLSKSIAVIIPIVLAGWDYCNYNKDKMSTFLRNSTCLVPHLLFCAAAALIAMKSQHPEYGGGRVGYINDSVTSHMLTMVNAVGKYAKNILFPTSLASFYDVPVVTGITASLLYAIIILAVIVILAFYLNKSHKPLFFCLILAVSAMLPVSNIIPLNTFINDRYLYLPMAGISALAASALFRLAAHRTYFRYLVIAAVCLPLAFVSWRQCEAWKNDINLWTNAVQKNPASFLLVKSSVALNGLAAAYLQEGRFQEAKLAAQQSLLRNPDNVIALNLLGTVYLQMEQFKAADFFLSKAIANEPNFVPAYINLAKSCIIGGELGRAELLLKKALETTSNNPNIYGLLAALHLTSGNYALARQHYARAEQIGGRSKDISFGMACLEARVGNNLKALEYLDMAFRQGFRDRAALLSSSGFDTIRNLPQYHSLLTKYGMN